jgi:hypothetical protein
MYRIDVRRGKNTMTRNAFYQLLRVVDTKTGRGTVLMNYGPLLADGTIPVKFDTGSYKIKSGTTMKIVDNIWNGTIKAKRKSGYIFQIEDAFTETFPSYRDAIAWLQKMTTAKQIAAIEKAILPDDEEEEVPSGVEMTAADAADLVVKPLVSNLTHRTREPAGAIEPTHEAWGTW